MNLGTSLLLPSNLMRRAIPRVRSVVGLVAAKPYSQLRAGAGLETGPGVGDDT